MAPSPPNVTQMLQDWSRGDPEAFDKLMPVVYDELRRQAAHYLRRERPDHTLQTTALIHEVYLRLVDQQKVDWQNRAHFYGIVARLMRQILVDHARAHHAAKRGGIGDKLPLEEAVVMTTRPDPDLVALDEALSRLEIIDPQQSQIVELRYFSGLSVEETAEVLKISPATIKRDWKIAKGWLRREMSR